MVGGAVPEVKAPATWYTVTGGNNDIYWRVKAPAGVTGSRVQIIHDDDTERLSKPTDVDPDKFSWQQRPDETFHYPNHEGTAVWTRPCLLRGLHALGMQENGFRTVAEVDDNYLSKPHLNLFMRVNKYGDDARQMHLRAMACFDGIAFSTRWLRDRYHKEMKGFAYIPDLHVCRNNLPDGDWPTPVPGNGRLRIGWMGSAQHARDIKLAGQALRWAREQGHEVILMGHDVRDETGVTGERALAETREWRKIISRHIPWVDPDEYHRSALPFDIGLAPLELNDHTLGKSDIKAIEYAASGAVPLLQNHPVYSGEWKHNETCLLAGGPAEFHLQLKALCESPSLRERLLSAARQYVREQRGSAAIRQEWGEALG